MRPAATKCCYLLWISYIRQLKKNSPKKWQKWKKKIKKWNLHPSAAIRAPSSASLKKGCLEHSKNAGFYKVSTTLQRETRCAWIWCKLLGFCQIVLKKKTSKKETSNKKHVFYCSRCKSGHFSWEGCYKIRGHQNHNNKRPRLSANGFACAWWQWTPKSEHSYTKREAVAVQGAQQ